MKKNGVILKTEQVPLQSIRQHNGYEPYRKLLTNVNYLFTDVELLTPAALDILIKHMPIVTLKHGNLYRYICGHRTFVIAAQMIDINSQISVQVAERLSKQEIRAHINADLCLFSIINGLKNKADLGLLLRTIECDSLFNSSTQIELARAVNCAKNTIFPPCSEEKI